MFGFYTEYGKKIKYIYLLNHTQSAPQPAAARQVSSKSLSPVVHFKF